MQVHLLSVLSKKLSVFQSVQGSPPLRLPDLDFQTLQRMAIIVHSQAFGNRELLFGNLTLFFC